MRTVLTILCIAFLILQYKMWFADGGFRETLTLKNQIQSQKDENQQLRAKNDALLLEIRQLKQGQEAVETRARNDLGMIKKDEKFYQVVEDK